MDKTTYEIKAQMMDLKAMIAGLTHEIKMIQIEHAEDRVLYKAINDTVKSLSAQVTDLDKHAEASQKATAQAMEQRATAEGKKMTLSELGALYRRDPVAGRRAAEAQGMKLDTGRGGNPWIYRDVTEQKRIRSIDPELADRLEAQAAARIAASIRR